MAEETITILKVGTTDAVRSVNDLRNNVAQLKAALGNLEIGTEEYQNTLEELKVNQNALKDAMYASTASMDDLSKAATGTSESYNGLVHQMAALKEELRATDVSTASGKARFKELATQISATNDKLKDMDALQGNFQRNVGNYPGLMKNFAGAMDGLDKGLKVTQGGVMGLKGGFDALSKTPIIGIIGMLISLMTRLGAKIKEDTTATEALKKMGEAFKPVLDFFSGVMAKIVDILGTIIDKVVQFTNSNGLFAKIVNGVVGVGNAILQFIIAPFKGIVAAIKTFKEQGVKGLGDAARAFASEMKSGAAFKSNFQAGQAAATAMIDGAKSKSNAATDTGKELGKAMAQGVEEGLADVGQILSRLDKRLDEARKYRMDQQKEVDAMIAEDTDATEEYVDDVLAKIADEQEEQEKEAVERKKARMAAISEVAGATASIMGSLAQMYESDMKNSQKNAKKIKALKIGEAIINTLSGAVGALATAATNPGGVPGMIIGTANAAAITAAGMAQIAQIRKTDVSGNSSSGTISPVATAPTLQPEVSNVRSVTSASEEERLNKMASEQRVYILSSDIEASQGAIRTRVAESSF